MDIKFKLLCVNNDDDNLTYIPENIVNIVNEILDKDTEKLIKIGEFSMDDEDSYSYGGVGCGDNYRISYINLENSKFAISYHYDGSCLDIGIEFNKNFNDKVEFIDIINNMKQLQLLWNNDLKDKAILEIQNKIKMNKEKLNVINIICEENDITEIC